jgi:hypothetical protein
MKQLLSGRMSKHLLTVFQLFFGRYLDGVSMALHGNTGVRGDVGQVGFDGHDQVSDWEIPIFGSDSQPQVAVLNLGTQSVSCSLVSCFDVELASVLRSVGVCVGLSVRAFSDVSYGMSESLPEEGRFQVFGAEGQVGHGSPHHEQGGQDQYADTEQEPSAGSPAVSFVAKLHDLFL